MMARRFIIILISLSLVFASSTAWQVPQLPSHTSKTQHLSRRSILIRASVFLTLVTPFAAPAITTDAAKTQWKESLKTIDNLLENWSTVAKGGDAIRVQLGTQGTTSPLFQIDKALKVLLEEADDIVTFAEHAEEFRLALARADSMAYSANFAGGSGKPMPPAVYIEQARKEVLEIQRLANCLSSFLQGSEFSSASVSAFDGTIVVP